jgi:hypothetical protein
VLHWTYNENRHTKQKKKAKKICETELKKNVYGRDKVVKKHMAQIIFSPLSLKNRKIIIILKSSLYFLLILMGFTLFIDFEYVEILIL